MMKPYYEDERVTIYHGDCRDILPTLPDNSVDLVLTSPPYNVGIDYGGGREGDKIDLASYRELGEGVLGESTRLLVSGGRLCLEIGGSGRNFPLSWLWQDIAYKHRLGLFSEIVLEHRKTNETAWGSWLKPDNVYTIPNFHLLYVFYKEVATKRGAGTDLVATEFSEWTRGRWNIQWRIHNSHPSSFPESFAVRCIKLFGHTNDVILDPFLGSGTTAYCAKKLGRKCIGVEIKERYCEIAANRCRQMVMDLI